MCKTFHETRLQLLLSPVVLLSTDVLRRPAEDSHLQQGFVVLSALQVRGHALFSLAGRKPDEETLEYGWMIEAILGQLTGRLSLSQLQHIVSGLEAFLHLAIDEENQLSRPKCHAPCHHGTAQLQCSYSTQNATDSCNLGMLCPSAEDIKYRMTRLSLDLFDVTLVESGTAFNLQVNRIPSASDRISSRNSLVFAFLSPGFPRSVIDLQSAQSSNPLRPVGADTQSQHTTVSGYVSQSDSR